MPGVGARLARAVALIATAAVAAAGSAGAGVGTSVPLGAIGFGSIAVDDANGHVFVSGTTANEVLVFDFSGNAVATIPSVYGAGAMVVHGSTLYVVEKNVGAIEAIDLATLADTGPVATGLASPAWLAFAGGKLWTSVNGQPGWAQLASVGLDGAVTVFPTSYYDPDFGTSAAAPNTLYVAEDGLSPGSIYRLDVSTGSPVVGVSTFTNQENIEQLAVSPDGTRVIAASGWPYTFAELSSSTLQPDGVVYPAQPYPSAVAASPAAGGLVATGLANGYSEPSISVFRLGVPQAIFTASTQSSSGTANVPPHGLALSADGSRLFAVTADQSGSPSEYHLSIFPLGPVATATDTSVALSPSPSGFGQAVTATATVSPTDAGGSVAFSLDGNPVAGCSAQPLSGAGTATCSLPSLAVGQNVVEAVYSGDVQYLGSSGQATTTVGKGTTSLAASPAQLVKGKNGALTTTLRATLSAYGAPVAGRTVTFTSAGTTLCTVATDSSGAGTCSVVIANGASKSLQKNGYTASFAGDSQYLASSAHASVGS